MKISRYFFMLLLIPGLIYAQQNIETVIKNGNEAFDKMEYEKALEIYEEALKAAPKEPIVFYNKGNVLQRLEKYDDALEDYNQALKNNPEKILLKNIYFNAGNAHYNIAKNKLKAGENDIEALKVALKEFESACNLYKKSLETEREIAISKGYDIEKTGVYAKKNWALSREGWANTWEKIRLLERQNMKLEDGVNNLLIAQLDILPRIETYYLYSLTDDNLKFNLKTLAQFQMDHKEDVLFLIDLAQKEVERVTAEVENYKSSQSAAQPQPQQNQPGTSPVLPEDGELKKLETQLKNTQEIKNAVDQVAGYEEWILDGLRRGEPLKAWENSYLMISILKRLQDYLKKNDAIKQIYEENLALFKAVSTVLDQAEIVLKENDTDKADAFLKKAQTLSTKKLDASALNVVAINSRMDMMISELEKQNNPPTPENEAGKQKDPVSEYFGKISLKIASKSLEDVQKRNSELLELIKITAADLLKGAPEGDRVSRMTEKINDCQMRYDHFSKSIIEMMTELVKLSDDLIHKLPAISENELHEVDDALDIFYKLTDIFLFKYQILVQDIGTDSTPELDIFRKKLPENNQNISSAWQKGLAIRSVPTLSKENLKKNLPSIRQLKTEIIRGLTILAPEVAASLYYEKIEKINKEILEALPSTTANQKEISSKLSLLLDESASLDTVINQVFENANDLLEAKTDEKEKEAAQKVLRQRKKSLEKLRTTVTEIRDDISYLSKNQFMKSDFLSKELPQNFGKSYVNFIGHPQDAVKTLESAIQLQTALKEQCRSVVDIEAQEGGTGPLKKYMVQNQNDILDFSGISISKIRQMLEECQKNNSQGNALQGAPGGNTCPAADPKKLEEAISYIQDAIIEEQKIHDFLNAQEYGNTFDNHDRVIELLNKALELLKNKDGEQGDQNQQDQNQDNEQQKQQNQQNQQDQSQQNQGEGEQKELKPLELTPEQARELLKKLDQEDEKRNEGVAEDKKPINVPRPW